jgi:hypothetical protein
VPLTWANFGGGMREILNGFKEAFGSAPFRKLCFSTFLIFNAFNTVAAFSFFIVVYHLFNGDTGAAWHLAHLVRQRRGADHHLRRHPHRGVDVAQDGQEERLHALAGHLHPRLRPAVVH